MDFIAHGRYQVQRGETVQSLSVQLDIPAEDLRKWNRLFGNEIYEGQILFLSDPNLAKASAARNAAAKDEAAAEATPEPAEPDSSETDAEKAANAAADAAVAEALKEMRLTAAQADMTSEDSIADEEAALAAALDAELKRELAAMAAKALSETSAPPAERPRNLSTRKLVGSGSILTAANEDAIRGMMPAFLQDETLTLVYSLLLHGSDMTSFFSCTKNYQYTIAVVQATTGEVFGGFNAVSWKHSPSYYGSGESFVFKLKDDGTAQVYKWTQKNNFVMWSDQSSLAMGGGGKGFAFVLSDDFYNGLTNRSDTFMNDPFVEGNEFRVDNVEIWAFNRYVETSGSYRRR